MEAYNIYAITMEKVRTLYQLPYFLSSLVLFEANQATLIEVYMNLANILGSFCNKFVRGPLDKIGS